MAYTHCTGGATVGTFTLPHSDLGPDRGEPYCVVECNPLNMCIFDLNDLILGARYDVIGVEIGQKNLPTEKERSFLIIRMEKQSQKFLRYNPFVLI